MMRIKSLAGPAAWSVATALLLNGCGNESGTTTAVPAAERTVKAEPVATDAGLNGADNTAVRAPVKESLGARSTDVASPLSEDQASRAGLDSSADVLKRTPTTLPVSSGPIVVVAEPAELLIGDIATGDTGVGMLVLRNTGDESRVVTRIKSSCGCTAADFKPGTVIQPGEAVEVEVRMKGGTVARNIRKTLTIQVEGQQDQVVPVVADVIAFIVIEPEQIGPERNPDGKVTLRAIDDQPFRIISMTPPVIEEFGEEPTIEHVLEFDWDRWNEVTGVQRSRKVIFYTDHPMAAQVYSTVYVTPVRVNTAVDSDQLAAQRQAAAARQQPKPSPYVELSSMLKRDNVDGIMAKVKEEGLSIEMADATGGTLLTQAAKYGSVKLITVLIEAGANLEAMDRTGGTPLMAAAQSKNAEAVRILLDAGANVAARDNIGRTAVSVAAGLGDPASVQVLIDAGAEVDIAGAFTGFTPLIWAAGFGEPASIPILVTAGANLEAADQIEGATPLIHAARTGKAGSVEALIASGAMLENTDRNGKTALLAAAGASNGTVAKLQTLLDAGADLNAKDNGGLSAIDFAKKRTDALAGEVVRFLEAHVAGN